MFEEARSILGMLKLKNMTQKQLAEFLGVSQPYVANKLRLLRFPEGMQKKIMKSGVSERHARALLRLPEELWETALENIRLGDMTVQESEIMIDCLLEEKSLNSVIEAPNYSDRICRFERGVELGLDNLRRFGIKANAEYEKLEDKLLISISVG